MNDPVVVYYVNADPPDLVVLWRDQGTVLDLTGGINFQLKVYVRGESTTPLINKTTGFAGSDGAPVPPSTEPTPNLQVTWDPNELNVLAPGGYVIEIIQLSGPYGDLHLFGELVIREPGPAWGYCEAPDVLVGNASIGPTVNVQAYVNAAADEMNADIGKSYDVPVDIQAAAVPTWVGLELKKINILLASGRLQQACSNGDKNTYAYGGSLVQEAKMCLNVLLSGSLEGVTPRQGTFVATAPAVSNQDASSGVDAFESKVMRDNPCAWWHPGPANVPRWRF